MKRKKKAAEEPQVLGQDTSLTKNRLANGVPHMKDLIAPPHIDRSSADHLEIGNKSPVPGRIGPRRRKKNGGRFTQPPHKITDSGNYRSESLRAVSSS